MEESCVKNFHLLFTLPPDQQTHNLFSSKREKNLVVQQKHTTFTEMNKNKKTRTNHIRLSRHCKNTSQSFVAKQVLQIMFYLSNLLQLLSC